MPTLSVIYLGEKRLTKSRNFVLFAIFLKGIEFKDLTSFDPVVIMPMSTADFSGLLRQYFSLYRAVSQREGERGETRWRKVKTSKHPPPAPTACAIGPSPTIIKLVRRPGTGSLPRTTPADFCKNDVFIKN